MDPPLATAYRPVKLDESLEQEEKIREAVSGLYYTSVQLRTNHRTPDILRVGILVKFPEAIDSKNLYLRSPNGSNSIEVLIKNIVEVWAGD